MRIFSINIVLPFFWNFHKCLGPLSTKICQISRFIYDWFSYIFMEASLRSIETFYLRDWFCYFWFLNYSWPTSDPFIDSYVVFPSYFFEIISFMSLKLCYVAEIRTLPSLFCVEAGSIVKNPFWANYGVNFLCLALSVFKLLASSVHKKITLSIYQS